MTWVPKRSRTLAQLLRSWNDFVYNYVAPAPAASGVTNGNSHNHSGGDGADINHSDLTGVSADQHHAETHVLNSSKHTVSGLTPGQFLRATAADTFGFVAHGLVYGDVGAAAASHGHAPGDITGTAVVTGDTRLSVQAAATASIRALGTGATDALPGNTSLDGHTPAAHTHDHGDVLVGAPCVLGRATAGAGAAEEIGVTGSGNVVLAAAPTLTGNARGDTLTLGGGEYESGYDFQIKKTVAGDLVLRCDNPSTTGRAILACTTETGGSFGMYAFGHTYAGSYVGINKADLSMLYCGGATFLNWTPYGAQVWSASATLEHMRLTTGGRLGIGASSPGSRLTVNNGTVAEPVADFQHNGTSLLKLDDADKIGFFNVATVARQAHIADAKVDYAATDLDTEAEIISAVNTANGKINSLIAALENYGLLNTA